MFSHMAIYYAYMFLLFIIIVNDITLNYNMSSYYTIVCQNIRIPDSISESKFPGSIPSDPQQPYALHVWLCLHTIVATLMGPM